MAVLQRHSRVRVLVCQMQGLCRRVWCIYLPRVSLQPATSRLAARDPPLLFGHGASCRLGLMSPRGRCVSFLPG